MGYCKVYFSDVEPLKDIALFEKFYSLITQKRKEKTDRYRFEKDKILSVGAGILLSEALKDSGADVTENDFLYNKNGKPYLPDGYGLYFNLSHSGTKVMCAVSDREIGCDVEKVGNGNIKIAKRYFSESEYGYISGMETEQEKDNAFCRLWTLKESYIKAVGTGLSVPLSSFSIDISDNGVTKIQNIDGSDFGFREFDLSDGYRYSMCVIDGVETEKADTVYFDFAKL